MATYKGIQGFNIQNLSADPSNPIEGQVWYNSTSNVWKVEEATTVGAWATGGNLSSARLYGGSAGGANDAFSIGGEAGPTKIDLVEEYNGTSWTTATAIPAATAFMSGAGSQTAGLGFGGQVTPGPPGTANTFTYDGSTWSPTGAMNTARGASASGGIQTAAFVAGGSNFGPPTIASTATENFNGTSWTSSGNLNTGRRFLAGAGTQTAGLAVGGYSPPATGATEEYNGATWTASNSLNTARGYLRGFGIQTVALAAGGLTPSQTNIVEEYDGTSWTSSTNLPTNLYAHYASGIGGNGTSGIIFGGQNPVSATTATQDYISAGTPTTKTITVS